MGPAKAVLVGFRAGRPEWVTVTVVPPSLGVKMTSRVEAPVRQDEAILDYSPATRSYRYTIDGGLPVADNRDRFAVEPAGSGAQIVWESSFTALDKASRPRSAGCGPARWRPCSAISRPSSRVLEIRDGGTVPGRALLRREPRRAMAERPTV
jgi:Polyketide cyclase / dehydrase and lipid transport